MTPGRIYDPARPGMVLDIIEPKGLLRKARGLIGSKGLGPGNGMLLRGKQVHAIGMLFTIDAIYLGPDGKVLHIKTLTPGSIGPLIWPGRWILELDAGEAARLGIEPGHMLIKEQLDEVQPPSAGPIAPSG